MPIFRHREDQVPVLIILAVFAVDLAVYALVRQPLWVAAWALLGLIPKLHICAWNHHHQHVPTFRQSWLNRALEVVYGLQTGITGHAWVLHHSIGHHVNYLDQARDESRWQSADGSTKSEWAYTLEVGLTAYPRAWKAGAKYPELRRVFVAMGLLTLAVVAALVAHSPLNGLLVFVAPMVACLFFTAWSTYSHHTGLSTQSHFVASNNILHRGYNLLTGNLGYHTAHHYRPGVHWSKLEALHQQIADRIPASCYLTPGLPWRLGQVADPPAPVPSAEPASAASA